MDHRPWFASYPEGVARSLAPYPEKSLYSILEEAGRRNPNAPAIAFWLPGAPMGKTLTYRELGKQVNQFSRVLLSLGVQRGDRVGLVLPNCPQFVIAYYAILRIGAVAVGNNPLYTERELSHQPKDAGIEVCVTLDVLYPKVAEVQDEVGLREIVVGRVTDFMPFPINLLAPIRMKKEARKHGEPWPPVPPGAKVRWWKELMAGSYPPAPVASVDATTDLAGLIYTGGTTGLSKGAMLTHFNLLANTMQGAAWFPDLREGKEGIMCIIPFFHSYGMTVAMNVGIYKAAKLVLMPRFELEPTLKVIQKEKPTMFPGVPRLYIAINEAKETPKHDLTSIRACLSGAAPLPRAVAEEFERITGAKVCEGYGLTETSPITHANPIYGKRKEGSIGLPIPDTDARVVDLDDWTREVEPGTEGELAVAGPQVMRGYFNRPEETAGMIKEAPDGTRWLLTGDIAKMDEEGYFSIVDRKKDMILVSGFNVYPTDIEQVIYRHPKVQKVCVAGIADATTGEAVKAYVVLKAGEMATPADIVTFCRNEEFGLSAYKVPKLVEFRESLPETLVGKVLRRVLAEEEKAKAAASGP
ncbi:MAG: long-chain fatty acid--CoA ligase [Actinobacteria bacterium]|nr:MAG: long-chain fatty acid--CoA ligase [Actinomycetota bacterium]